MPLRSQDLDLWVRSIRVTSHSMYPNSMYFGPKAPIKGLLYGLSIYNYYLGTWAFKPNFMYGIPLMEPLKDLYLGTCTFGFHVPKHFQDLLHTRSP